MGSFPEVRSKDARACTIRHFRHPVRGILPSPATLHHQQTFASESEKAWFMGHTGVIHSVHPPVSFLKNHCHHYQLHRTPQSNGRLDDHDLPDTVS